MSIEDLEGTPLDAQVLTALGLDVSTFGELISCGKLDGVPIALVGDPALSPFLCSPSRQWALGGFLIQQLAIGVTPVDCDNWQAVCRGFTSVGPTPLVAAMRALCVGLHDLPPIDLHRIRECSMRQIVGRFGEGFVHDRLRPSEAS